MAKTALKKDATKTAEKEKSDVVKKVETKSKKKASPKKAPVARKEKKCQVGKCKREYRAKGYCGVHYKKWRQGAFGVARYKTCGASDCRKAMVTNRHGYCEEHYQNYYVKGMAAAKAAPAEEKPAEEKKAANA